MKFNEPIQALEIFKRSKHGAKLRAIGGGRFIYSNSAVYSIPVVILGLAGPLFLQKTWLILWESLCVLLLIVLLILSLSLMEDQGGEYARERLTKEDKVKAQELIAKYENEKTDAKKLKGLK